MINFENFRPNKTITILFSIILLLSLSNCLTSYDKWYGKNGAVGTYRIIEEKYFYKHEKGKGRLTGKIFDAFDRKSCPALLTISNKDSTIELSSLGEFTIDLEEDVYTLSLSSVGHHNLATKTIQIREGYETKMEFFLGADY